MQFIKNLFNKQDGSNGGIGHDHIKPTFDDNGIHFPINLFSDLRKSPPHIKSLHQYLKQLEEEEYVTQDSLNWTITWDQIYSILNNEEHLTSLKLLAIPDLAKVKPEIVGSGSLSDENFSLSIKSWILPDGTSAPLSARKGAVIEQNNNLFLMTEDAWNCLSEIKKFHFKKRTQSGEELNKASWALIRKYGTKADAVMDVFLEKTIVLKPEQLQLKLNKSNALNTSVIQVSPEFEEQPENWIKTFDKYQTVQDQYHISSDDGSVTHLVIEPEVKSVLETVKSMPARTVAGDKALMFIKNPYATLGEDAQKVLDEKHYENQVKSAGISFYRFYVEPILDQSGTKIESVQLILTPQGNADIPNKQHLFSNAYEFQSFVSEISHKLTNHLPCCYWKSYELELSDVTESILHGIEQLAIRWVQEAEGKVFENVLDLSQYGDRVIGIGVATPITSPFIKKEKTEDWIELAQIQELGFDAEILSKWDDASYLDYEIFVDNIKEAKLTGKENVVLPGIELEIPIKKAELVAQIWEKKFKQDSPGGVAGEEKFTKLRSVLLLDDNIDAVKYIEERAEFLNLDDPSPKLPSCIRPEITLKEHQLYGVAWLQNLLDKSPTHVTGCLLADDMGLGKTIQLLTFMLSYLEFSEAPKPCLVVAPVALLDNWENEFHKFFDAKHVTIKKLYGKSLAEVKYRKDEIPFELRSKGIENLLRPNWVGDAKIILTTYETLRDQQFSFAQQQWGIVVCDEAQKIKTPGILVTEAAKAVAAHAHFKIACTGTPVENTLIDLWCLFDFFQAGFLGALNEFAVNFKRPIECETEMDKIAIERLKLLIEPQILRRLKSEVAKDLPNKIEDEKCKSLLMSQNQDKLYQDKIAEYEHKKEITEMMGHTAGAAMLGLLHNLKLICAHPVSVAPAHFNYDQSPKLAWLLKVLADIQARNEKAIVFTELRDIQRDLQLAILDKFDFEAKIINGDTNSSSEKGANRQSIIDDFQKKPGFGVIILSTTAVGFGVNVQAANHVIHFTRPWNPAKEDQATDRAYRIGQTKDVYVYYPIVNSQSYATFEKKLDGLLANKRALAGNMLNGYDEVRAVDLFKD